MERKQSKANEYIVGLVCRFAEPVAWVGSAFLMPTNRECLMVKIRRGVTIEPDFAFVEDWLALAKPATNLAKILTFDKLGELLNLTACRLEFAAKRFSAFDSFGIVFPVVCVSHIGFILFGFYVERILPAIPPPELAEGQTGQP